MPRQFRRIPTGMGDVASPPSTDPYFLEWLRCGLNHQHPTNTFLGSRDRSHETSCSTTDHH